MEPRKISYYLMPKSIDEIISHATTGDCTSQLIGASEAEKKHWNVDKVLEIMLTAQEGYKKLSSNTFKIGKSLDSQECMFYATIETIRDPRTALVIRYTATLTYDPVCAEGELQEQVKEKDASFQKMLGKYFTVEKQDQAQA